MPEPPPRFYLIVPPGDPVTSARLAEALSAGDVACVLFAGIALDGEDRAEQVRLVQSHGAAALVAGDAAAADTAEADGVHVEAGGNLHEAVRRMKPSRIVGVGGLLTRDDAMAAGEQDVDYLLFGEAAVGATPLPFDERLERVAWWAEIFRVPCVAMAHAVDEIAPLVEAGAEFVGLGDVVWTDPRGPAAPMRDATEALRQGHAAYLARQDERV